MGNRCSSCSCSCHVAQGIEDALRPLITTLIERIIDVATSLQQAIDDNTAAVQAVVAHLSGGTEISQAQIDQIEANAQALNKALGAGTTPPTGKAAIATLVLGGAPAGQQTGATLTTTVNGASVVYTEAASDVDLPTLAASLVAKLNADSVLSQEGTAKVSTEPPATSGTVEISVTAKTPGAAGNVPIAVSTTDTGLTYAVKGGGTSLTGGA